MKRQFDTRLASTWPLVVVALVTCGCMQPDLEDYYGRHQIPSLSASVNGTDVLVGMFIEAGHKTYYRRTLVTSEMRLADTVVWFPNDPAAPSNEVVQWFNAWLAAAPGRTLVFVGRDFDAAPLYWKHMKSEVDPDQRKIYEWRQRSAGGKWPRWSELESEDLGCEWFRYDEQQRQDARSLAGPWSAGIDAEGTEIELGTRIVPARSAQRLLTSGDEILAARFTKQHWGDSQILLVANGSFLLNLPLVNHEHRKLAGRLIAQCGAPGRVVFLESGRGGPPVDPPYADDSLWTVFGAWPLNAILLQLALVGVIFCFARWPIFGRPRQPPPEAASDFGRHVEAVGQLLSRTRDRSFAIARARGDEALADATGSAAVALPVVRTLQPRKAPHR